MAAHPPRGWLLACCALAALLAPDGARADSLVAELARETPISAYGGALAWSAYDEATRRYALMIRQGARTAAAPVATAKRAFDVSLGPDVRGRVVALYTRCRTAVHGCDVYRYGLRARSEQRLAAVSSPVLDEAWPAQWGDRIAFSRRIHARPASHRGRPRWCPTPFVKRLSSRAPSRRLDSRCGPTVGIAIRGQRIIQVTDNTGDSDVFLLHARGGAARLLGHGGSGEGGSSPFVSPNLSASALWLTRTGEREGVPEGFLRIDLPSGRMTTVRSNVPLAGRVARDERGSFWYLQGREPSIDDHGAPPFCESALDPCRLVRASASPFSAVTRVLLPRLRRLSPDAPYLTVFADEPVALRGDLTQPVVRASQLVAQRPVGAATLSLLVSTSFAADGALAPTGVTTRTDAAGRWSVVLHEPPPAAVLTIAALGTRLRSAAIQIVAESRMTLAAGGRTLTGTVSPPQPGRAVEIIRLLTDEQGLLPGEVARPGEARTCPFPTQPEYCDPAAWLTVEHVPLDATGTAFSTPVTTPGVYWSRLSRDGPGGAGTAFGGFSRAVTVAG